MANGFIRIDDSQIRELDTLLSGTLPSELAKGRRIALSRTRRGAQQRVSTLIRARGDVKYNIPARRAKAGITVTSIKNESFFVIGENKPLSLTSFSGTRDLSQSGRGVSVAVRKRQRTRIATAFIRTTSNAKQVYRREFISGSSGKQVGRYPIQRLVGPSIANMMNRNNAEEDMAGFLQERFDTELERAIKFAVRKRK